MIWALVPLLVFTPVICLAQKVPAAPLEEVVAYWSSEAFDTAELLANIDKVGFDFDLSEANLSSLLKAAAKGNRKPDDVAKLLVQLFQRCRLCRAELWRPLTGDDIFYFLEKKDSAYALRELQDRRSRPLQVSAAFLRELAAKGAKEDLLGAVSETFRIDPPANFRLMETQPRRANDFKAYATSGRVILAVEFSGDVEFVFRHGALFYRVHNGVEPKDAGSSYSSLGPMTDAKDLSWNVDTKVSAKDYSKSFVEDPSGLNGFRIKAHSKKRRLLEFHITWKPKTAA